jgi:hypothetical protein
MSDQPPADSKPIVVFPLTFSRAAASDDGQTVFFEVLDNEQKPARLQVHWQNLSTLAHMLNQAGVDAAERRKAKGDSSEFQGVGMAQIVKGFRVATVPERKLKIVSLFSPSGLRADFALSLDSRDNQGRSFPQALSEELIK